MEGPSRQSWVSAVGKVHEIQSDRSLDLRALAAELFAVAEAMTGQPKLRRALADASRDALPKRDLAHRLFASRISPPAMAVLEVVVSQRWVRDQDLVDGLERLGIDTVLAAAEREGHLEQVENELFDFERTVSATPELRLALRSQEATPEAKAAMIVRLLSGKVLQDTLWLAQRPVLHPRGRRYSAAIWRQLTIASRRRQAITAIVTSAVELTDDERERMRRSLAVLYDRPISLQTVVDPDVRGGVHVRVGDEVVDGSIARRIEEAGVAMGMSRKDQRSA